ncbi:MAG: hypothetical protein J6C87_08635 [Bacteroides sp.]|nr:hypothetical protein [Bacteroides sp.]
MQPAHNGTLQFVVSDFPAFGEDPETRAIGTQDAGKAAWEKDDEIIVELNSSKYGTQFATLIYDSSQWNLNGSLLYLENETPVVYAYYAPCYEVTGNTMNLRTGMLDGMTEYLEAFDCQVENNTISISFEDVTRDYSRLRIVGLANQTLTVTTTDFTPAAATSEATEAYTLTADSLGNTYLYGTFAKDATVTVKQGTATLAGFTFSEDKGFANGTEHNKSYALDARVAQVTEEYIDALVETLKANADNDTSTVITGNAMITVDGENKTAIGEAISRLSDDEDYYGKIDLILQDATEIIDQEFAYAYALNSITLPKVTKLGSEAFAWCEYLTKITFESVVTAGIENGSDVFRDVGYAYDGSSTTSCDLFLNCEQENAELEYQPYIDVDDTYWWWETEWKSFTLTHSGDNMYCNVCLGY